MSDVTGTFTDDQSGTGFTRSRGSRGEDITRGPLSQSHSMGDMSHNHIGLELSEGPTRFTFRFDADYLERSVSDQSLCSSFMPPLSDLLATLFCAPR